MDFSVILEGEEVWIAGFPMIFTGDVNCGADGTIESFTSDGCTITAKHMLFPYLRESMEDTPHLAAMIDDTRAAYRNCQSDRIADLRIAI